MTDQQILDTLRQINAEAQDALKKDNQAALDAALKNYDEKFSQFEKQLNKVEASVKTIPVNPGGGEAPTAIWCLRFRRRKS